MSGRSGFRTDRAEPQAAAASEIQGCQNWFAELADANRRCEAACAKRVDEPTHRG
jgi:hypothetical protein